MAEKDSKPMPMPSKARFIWKKCWKPLFTIMIPVLLSGIFFWGGMPLDKKITSQKGKTHLKDNEWMQPRAAFVILLMAFYWITECLPLSVTALLPVVLFPLFQISDTEAVTSSYLGSSVTLLLSGCIIALSFEYSNLHTRIALFVITKVGAQIPRLLFGIMLTAMFLSMWMNNTSTTAMMVPIVYVIMDEFEHVLKEEKLRKLEQTAAAQLENFDELSTTSNTSHVAMPNVDHSHVDFKTKKDRFGLDAASTTSIRRPKELSMGESTVAAISAILSPEDTAAKIAKESRDIKIMFLLGVAWAANIGGTGVITGTATNVIAQDEASKKTAEVLQATEGTYKNMKKCTEHLDINFLDWMLFNFFPMLINTILTWAILLVYYTGIPLCLKCWRRKTVKEIKHAKMGKKLAKNIEAAIRAKYAQLGPTTLHEILVTALFVTLVLLWVSGGKIGWFQLFTFENTKNPTYLPHDAVPAIFVCIFLFVLPKEKKYYKNILKGDLGAGMRDPVLVWKLVETKVPWGPLILIGGGSAISSGIKAAGLGDAIGSFLEQNKKLTSLESWQFMIIILIIVAILTTIASNTATAAILSPVLLSLAFSKCIHPKYMLVIPTVAASYAFLLPISTPPNAIVFDKSDMKQSEMALPGMIVTVVTNLTLFALAHSFHEGLYHFNSYDQACCSRN